MKIAADQNIPFVKECFSSIADVELFPGRQITNQHIKNADCLLVRSTTQVNRQLLDNTNIKFVATATIGFEHIDIDYLKERNIGFASAPGCNANSVAEYIIAAILEIAQKNKIDLEDKSIGIIGVGNVGSKVAKKCASLKMKTLLNDPPLQRKTNDSIFLPIEKLYGCDFITLHTPLTFDGQDKTFHLADENFFNSLKPGCCFINTARGPVNDTNALIQAAKNQKLKNIILDVWENEPNITPELLELADIATPHIAGYSFDGKISGLIMIYKAACAYFHIAPEYTEKSFLPPAEIPSIKIHSSVSKQQKILYETVKKVYDIKTDDTNLRKIMSIPESEKSAFFDELRASYPVRREFRNTTLSLEQYSEILAKKLSGIGFSVKR